MSVRYKKRYQYELLESFSFKTSFKPATTVELKYIRIDVDGRITAKPGYAWDGATGAIDTKSTMKASLIHDVCYQLLNLNVIPMRYRKEFDVMYYQTALRNGMFIGRAFYHYAAVRMFGDNALRKRSSYNREYTL